MTRPLVVALLLLVGCQPVFDPPRGIPIAAGSVYAEVRGNETVKTPYEAGLGDLELPFAAREVDHLSGLSLLSHASDGATAWDDARRTTQAVGLNFEHIMRVGDTPANHMAPRRGAYPAALNADGSVTLSRARADEVEWDVSSTLTYRAVAPHYVDFDFCATIHDASRFGPERAAGFFFASYMRSLPAMTVRFPGFPGPGESERWVSMPDTASGNTAVPLESAREKVGQVEPNVDWPRIARPVYWGDAGGGMVYAVMFDHLWSPEEEVRFSVYRWKRDRSAPAFDFYVVARGVEDGRRVRLRGRLVWKRFVNEEDVGAEFDAWLASLPPR